MCELAGFRTCTNCVRDVKTGPCTCLRVTRKEGHDSGVAEENIWVGGRQLHNKELHNLAQIPSERENEGDMMVGSCSMYDTEMGHVKERDRLQDLGINGEQYKSGSQEAGCGLDSCGTVVIG